MEKSQSSIDAKYYYVNAHYVIFYSDRPKNDRAVGLSLLLE